MNNDLISRSALKKALKSKTKDIYEFVCLSRVLEEIDNAPTVELDEMTQDLIDKVNVNVGLAQPIKDERQQGDVRWTEKLSVKSNGDIINIFEGRVVGHINLEDKKGGKNG